MSQSQTLPNGWELLDRDTDPGKPAYHNPTEDPAPYIQIYGKAEEIDAEHEYKVVAYPEGTDLGEKINVSHTDTIKDAKEAAKRWIRNLHSTNQNPPITETDTSLLDIEKGETVLVELVEGGITEALVYHKKREDNTIHADVNGNSVLVLAETASGDTTWAWESEDKHGMNLERLGEVQVWVNRASKQDNIN